MIGAYFAKKKVDLVPDSTLGYAGKWRVSVALTHTITAQIIFFIFLKGKKGNNSLHNFDIHYR